MSCCLYQTVFFPFLSASVDLQDIYQEAESKKCFDATSNHCLTREFQSFQLKQQAQFSSDKIIGLPINLIAVNPVKILSTTQLLSIQMVCKRDADMCLLCKRQRDCELERQTEK